MHVCTYELQVNNIFQHLAESAYGKEKIFKRVSGVFFQVYVADYFAVGVDPLVFAGQVIVAGGL